MTAAAKKKPAVKTGRPAPPKNRARVNKQFTLAPTEIAILEEWRVRFGDGTLSLLVGMAIAHAKRTGLFDHLPSVDGSVPAPPAPISFESAIRQHAPQLLDRLVSEAMKPRTGG